MKTARTYVPAAPRLTVADVLVVLWVALWIGLAIAVADATRDLAELGETIVETGGAIEDLAGLVPDLPLVGDPVGEAAGSVAEAGRSAAVSGESGADATRRLSVLLLIVVAVVPSVPIAGLYAPLRMARLREARAVRAAVARYGRDPVFLEFLARRAAENLPFEELRELSAHPWEDLREGRFEPLAAAELDRLGIGESRSQLGGD